MGARAFGCASQLGLEVLPRRGDAVHRRMPAPPLPVRGRVESPHTRTSSARTVLHWSGGGRGGVGDPEPTRLTGHILAIARMRQHGQHIHCEYVGPDGTPAD